MLRMSELTGHADVSVVQGAVSSAAFPHPVPSVVLRALRSAASTWPREFCGLRPGTARLPATIPLSARRMALTGRHMGGRHPYRSPYRGVYAYPY